MKQQAKHSVVRRVLSVASPYRWELSVYLLVVILDAIVGIIYPLLYRQIINSGILKGDSPRIVHLAALVALLGFINGALGLLGSYLASRIGARIVLSLRTELFDHIQRMPLAFFARTQTGALVTRLNNDVGGVRSAFVDLLPNVMGNLITVILILAAMCVLSWRITLASIMLLPLFMLPAQFWGRKLKAIIRENYDLTAAMNSWIVERFNVAGAVLAKLFGRRDDERGLFESNARRVADIEVEQSLFGRLHLTAMLVMATSATALAYGWGGFMAVKHGYDVGTVVALVSYLARLYTPILGLANVQVGMATARISFERVFEILDLQPMIREKPDAACIPPGPATIRFDRVSFHYPSPEDISLASLETIALADTDTKSTVLFDVSFTAEPGQLIAVVGPSGAGKTTITNLLPRLYDVACGSITINGLDVRDAKFESLRNRIGVVTQDSHLFHDTIRANLLYAKPDATEAEIRKVLGEAQILSLVESLPEGLDTVVGEHGYRFSGGEKQRLAIARLLLKAPDIVILDEATAHLDSESEAVLQRALEEAFARRTSIVIAHRLSTILKANRILVIQNGRIVQNGTHRELLEQPGIYRELCQRQFSNTTNAAVG